MRVNFQLLPVDEIPPWGEEQPSLSWFGLTDGWYWIQAGDAELFRYSSGLLAQDEPWRSNPLSPPYVDYYVARLWEDLIEILPSVLDPVPEALARRLAHGAAWQDWVTETLRWVEGQSTLGQERYDAAWDLYHQALAWWHARALTSHHLRQGPRIWFWRMGEAVHLRWDNRELLWGGRPVWEALAGEEVIPVDTFVEEVRSFDSRFMATMAARIEAVRTHWSRPDIHVDVFQLEQEQNDRATWLAGKLDRLSYWTPNPRWDDVLARMALIEERLSSRG